MTFCGFSVLTDRFAGRGGGRKGVGGVEVEICMMSACLEDGGERPVTYGAFNRFVIRSGCGRSHPLRHLPSAWGLSCGMSDSVRDKEFFVRAAHLCCLWTFCWLRVSILSGLRRRRQSFSFRVNKGLSLDCWSGDLFGGELLCLQCATCPTARPAKRTTVGS